MSIFPELGYQHILSEQGYTSVHCHCRRSSGLLVCVIGAFAAAVTLPRLPNSTNLLPCTVSPYASSASICCLVRCHHMPLLHPSAALWCRCYLTIFPMLNVPFSADWSFLPLFTTSALIHFMCLPTVLHHHL